MQNITKISILGLAVLTLLAVGDSQYADAWPSNPTVNVAICTASGDQLSTQIVADNAGGAIIVWEDGRGSDKDIYARRVNASGTPLWAANGVVICNASGNQESPQLVSDGSGGAIITWQDYRNGSHWDIYAQRINSSGERQWTPSNGVPICTYSGDGISPQIASDGASGAIITWTDGRGGVDNNDIYAQRVNNSGAIQWTTNGVSISVALDHQENPQIISDGSGGAIIAWEDFRDEILTRNIYAQRVDSNGNTLWTSGGVPICTATGEQYYPQLVGDGSQGAILTWQDERDDDGDIYAQRVKGSDGARLWTPDDGVSICTASNQQRVPQLISDGSGSAIITWEDRRNGNTNKDIYARKVDADGTPQWTSNGSPICTSSGNQVSPQIVLDGVSGAIIVWQDVNDIYAQRVNSSGTAQWTPNGVAISTASNNQSSPQLVSDGSEGAIVTWQDGRNSNEDIYAQRVFSDSSLPVFLSSFTASVSDGQILIRWRTESEVGNLGWNIYRKSKQEREFTKINDHLLSGAGNSVMPQEYQYFDTAVKEGITYYYYLENIDISGIRNKSQIIQVTVGWALPTLLPTCTTVFQNFPNPFNPETMIPYQLAEASLVTIEIYNANGQLVRMLNLGRKDANFYLTRGEAAYWDGRNDAKEKVASGIYFYRLKTNKSVSMMKKMAISK